MNRLAILLTFFSLALCHGEIVRDQVSFPYAAEPTSGILLYSTEHTGGPPVVVFPDSRMSISDCSSLGERLANAGYFVLILSPSNGSVPNNDSFIDDMKSSALWRYRHDAGATAIAWVISQQKPNARFFNFIQESPIGVIGIGYGGYVAASFAGFRHGGAFSKIGIDEPRVGAVVTMGMPVGLLGTTRAAQFSDIKKPFLSFYASDDHTGGLKVTDDKKMAAYNSVSGPAYHAGMPGANFKDYTFSGSQRLATITGLIDVFFRAYLLSDETARTWLDSGIVIPLIDFSAKH